MVQGDSSSTAAVDVPTATIDEPAQQIGINGAREFIATVTIVYIDKQRLSTVNYN